MKKAKLKISDALGAYVRSKFTRAVEHKQSTTNLLRECSDQLRGTLPCGSDEDVPIYMNITAPMVRGVEGLLSNVVVGSSTSRVFVIKPSPEPELSDEDQMMLQNKLAAEITNILGGIATPATVDKELRNMEAGLKTEQVKLSIERAEKLTTVLHDKLIESNWYDVQSNILRSFCSNPTAIAKYPAVKSAQVLSYDGTSIVPETKHIKTVESISAYNFFPAPGAECPQTAEFVIELRKGNRNDLLDYAAVPGYDSEGLLHLLEEYPNGYEEISISTTAQMLEDNDDDDNGEEETSINLYDILGFFGKIPGSYLAQYSVQVDDENRLYEAEIWTCADIVIRATLNPHPLGKRPFYAASFEAIEGSFWGNCVTTKVAEPQRVCTAAVKAAIRNAAFSSGPVGEVDESRVADEDDPTVIEPFVLKLVKPDRNGGGHRAYNLDYVRNITGELLNLYSWGKDQAYDMLGLTKAAFGNSEDLGTVGRTSGGVAMILKRADHPIRLSAREFEKRFIEEILQDMITDLMLYSQDDSIKGDMQVYAIGVSGLVEQEKKDSDFEWALQSVTAMMNITGADGNPIIPREAPIRLLYELFKSKGIPTAGVFPDFELLDAVNTARSSSVPAAAPESPISMLDGRSSTAISEINASSGGPYG